VSAVKPQMIDLFCGAGGAAVGYARAGFDVVGVDIAPQPNYPFEFHQGDALEFLAAHGHEFDAVHASPPCQAYSTLRAMHPDNIHPDLVDPTRRGLLDSGLPFVMENVVGAPMRNAVTLCGSMFGLSALCRDGVRRQLRRHRLFETNVLIMLDRTCEHSGQPIGVYGDGGGGSMTRGYKSIRGEDGEAMGMDWGTRREISQAIPPAFTEYLGAQLLTCCAAVGA